jgi:hypothetical protein
MKWYIGQEVICVESHSQKIVKKGQVYEIKSLRSGFCKCSKVLIDVGIKQIGTSHCGICEKSDSEATEVWWFYEKYFAPLEYNKDEIEKLLENTLIEKI